MKFVPSKKVTGYPVCQQIFPPPLLLLLLLEPRSGIYNSGFTTHWILAFNRPCGSRPFGFRHSLCFRRS
jgi:hypothetical protein